MLLRLITLNANFEGTRYVFFFSVFFFYVSVVLFSEL
jgi:hypothetical protein